MIDIKYYEQRLADEIDKNKQLKEELATMDKAFVERSAERDKLEHDLSIAKFETKLMMAVADDTQVNLQHALESVKMATQMFESIIARSHTWVITEKTGFIERPLHDSYRQLAEDAQTKLKERHGELK